VPVKLTPLSPLTIPPQLSLC